MNENHLGPLKFKTQLLRFILKPQLLGEHSEGGLASL